MEHISIEQFRYGMQQLTAGVCIITTEHEGICAGLTATAVCSLSAQPPRLLASINRKGMTYDVLASSRKLCVNILAREQIALARIFATPTPRESDSRFEGDQWKVLETGAPVLKGALTNFDCYVASIIDAGTHGIVIADIVGVNNESGLSPLLYANGIFLTAGEAL